MILYNLRSAYRNLRAAPGFAVTATLSLGIGIAGTLAMFTLVNSILLKPLVYPESERLVFITQSSPGSTAQLGFGVAPIQFLRWRAEMRSFESLAVLRKAMVNMTGSGEPVTLRGARISAELFDTLGAVPERGRWFRREDEARGAADVAIITAQMWRQHFGADPKIIGKKVVLDGAPHEIVGVTRPDLRFFRNHDLHSGWDLAVGSG
jgi:hypothetical protein